MRGEAETVRTPQEIAEAVSAFSDAQWARLGLVGERYAWKTRWQGDDLVHEAIARALKGDRQCPVGIDVFRFLAEAIRSIADDETNKLEGQSPHKVIRRGAGGDDHGVDLADPGPNGEQAKLQAEEIAIMRERIMTLFKDDKLALDIITCDLADYTAGETREVLEIDEKTYNSGRRRIRRALNKLFAHGQRP